ncbi:apextrin-like protein 2 [Elysia marginata]|uniref:Apextrin-like protein 2 n=1 Tax=Elysia marginata TaxID=1093978 RepID=A0AAV4FTG3_9GAST|nr:apextrin-like protein 2 [Elysia marginata]
MHKVSNDFEVLMKMGRFVQSLALLFFIQGCYCFLVKSESESVKPFRLTYSPAHIVAYITRDVTLRCEDDVFAGASSLEEVSRIRILKNSPAGWNMVAELRDLEDRPRKTLNVTVSGKIGQIVRNTFLEVTWDIATKETPGTYMCELIGFDKNWHHGSIEFTSELVIKEENVTTDDIVDVLRDLRREVVSIEERTNKYEDFLSSFDDSYKDIKQKTGNHSVDITSIKKDIGALHSKISSAAKNFTSVTENIDVLSNHSRFVDETLKSLMDDVSQLDKKLEKLNGENNALSKTSTSLAEDVSDIEKNFTSFTGEMKALENIVEFLTVEMESLEERVGNLSGEIDNRNSPVQTGGRGAGTFKAFLKHFAKLSGWPDGKYAIPAHIAGCPLDVTFFGGRHMYLATPINSTTKLHYLLCESSREVGSKRPWPEGSYCVNKVAGLDCPHGLQKGMIDLSAADADIHIFQGVSSSSQLWFCCKKSVPASVPIVLPTHSPFILYRVAGRCQEVQGMTVKDNFLKPPIETSPGTSSIPGAGVIPDAQFYNSLIWLHICVYTEE